MTRSVLDDIPGLGPGRRKKLLAELGGVNAVKAASLETLLAISWLPDTVARAVYQKIHGLAAPARPSTAPTPSTVGRSIDGVLGTVRVSDGDDR
jgi:excinuclease ABC subunit C